MALFSSFEILAELLVPVAFAPPGVPNPLLIQGYFLQISLQPGKQKTGLDIVFAETTGFTQGGGSGPLLAQYIDPKGNVNQYNQFFGSVSQGFLGFYISPGETWVFGVQAIPIPSSGEDAAFPQAGIGWRGTVSINPQYAGSLFATATHRQVFLQGPTIKSGAINGAAYAVPSFNGTGAI